MDPSSKDQKACTQVRTAYRLFPKKKKEVQLTFTSLPHTSTNFWSANTIHPAITIEPRRVDHNMQRGTERCLRRKLLQYCGLCDNSSWSLDVVDFARVDSVRRAPMAVPESAVGSSSRWFSSRELTSNTMQEYKFQLELESKNFPPGKN